MTQQEGGYSCRSEDIISLRQSKHLQNTYGAFKHYFREEVIMMTKLELFLILVTGNYLKDILIPEKRKLLKHPMDLGEFFTVDWTLVLHDLLGQNF